MSSGVREVIKDKTVDRVNTIAPWMFVHIQKWLETKPTGSATITIQIDANQGGVGKIGTGFTIKESI